MTREATIMARLHDDLKRVTGLGYKVFGIFLQGSQNYNLDYEGSDIDTKCIVMPTFDDIVLNNQPTSYTLVRAEDNAHIDIKDIRLMWECFKKQNINFLEILFTDFYIVNNKFQSIWETMRAHAEDIAHYDNYKAVNCIAGMVMEKEKALCHPYPTLKDKIDAHGYDNKQLHHIFRCREFLERYINGVPYKECLIPTNSKFLVEVKSNYIYNKDEAVDIAKSLLNASVALKNNYIDHHLNLINEETDKFMKGELVKAMKLSIVEDLQK